MFNAFLVIFTPLLLVFGLYHLFTWFNVFHINERPYWKRVGLTAATAHFLLATGFFAFTYLDLQGNRTYVLVGMSYGTFLFSHSAFWQLAGVFDTLALLGILATFTVLDRAGVSGPLLGIAVAATYILGTLQWYFIGGGLGTLLQKFWDGLKSDEEDEDWFQ